MGEELRGRGLDLGGKKKMRDGEGGKGTGGLGGR